MKKKTDVSIYTTKYTEVDTRIHIPEELRAELDADPIPTDEKEFEQWYERQINKVDKQIEDSKNRNSVILTFIPKPRKVGRKVDWSETFAVWEKVTSDVPITLEELADLLDYKPQTVRKRHAKYQNSKNELSTNL